ncbi:MAG: MarR family winged helix-turn-helix transcriptional regulator [Solidesulfovibrio sp.]
MHDTTDFERTTHTGDELHLLREIFRTNQTLLAGFSRKVGQPASRFALMRLLATAREPVGVMDLARLLGINAAAVTRQVKEMETEGLVERQPAPRDGRRSFLNLSPQGLELFAVIHKRGHALESAFATAVGVDKIRAVVDVLTQLRGFLENFPNGDAP